MVGGGTHNKRMQTRNFFFLFKGKSLSGRKMKGKLHYMSSEMSNQMETQTELPSGLCEQ